MDVPTLYPRRLRDIEQLRCLNQSLANAAFVDVGITNGGVSRSSLSSLVEWELNQSFTEDVDCRERRNATWQGPGEEYAYGSVTGGLCLRLWTCCIHRAHESRHSSVYDRHRKQRARRTACDYSGHNQGLNGRGKCIDDGWARIINSEGLAFLRC